MLLGVPNHPPKGSGQSLCPLRGQVSQETPWDLESPCLTFWVSRALQGTGLQALGSPTPPSFRLWEVMAPFSTCSAWPSFFSGVPVITGLCASSCLLPESAHLETGGHQERGVAKQGGCSRSREAPRAEGWVPLSALVLTGRSRMWGRCHATSHT